MHRRRCGCGKPFQLCSLWQEILRAVRNSMIERLARAFPHRYQRLRYEDFAARPRATIDHLLAFTGLPGTRAPFIEDATVVLRPNHTIAGNPARFKTAR